MAHYRKVVTKRIVSADGKIIAEAKSVVEASGDGQNVTNQSVSVNISSSNSSSSSSSSSASSSSSSSKSSS